MKHEALISELNGQDEPTVKMWVDKSSIFWLSENQGPIWMADHKGLFGYINSPADIEYRQMPEGVGNEGVEWVNSDFESPFHISDFERRIKEINKFNF